ncbi:MAG: hypothetical protein AB1724_11835 [Thermodesulfobacteriota bacterium]
MNVSPADGGTVTSPQFETPIADYPASFTCSDTYDLTAVPNANEGYEFVDWVVNATTQAENPLTVDVSEEAKAVTAFFRIAGAPNTAPTADAGDDQAVDENAFVILNGSGSFDPNNDIRKYQWQQTSGTAVTLSNPAAINPTFSAPAVSAAESPIILIFQLTVEDVPGETGTDTVAITVADSGNDPPVANAGLDQTVEEGDLVTLDGTGTADPNGSNDIKSYTWEQLEGKEVILSNNLLVNPTFTAPDVEVVEDPLYLVFKLIVEDFAGLESEDTVTIKVKRGPIGGSSAGCFITEAGR